MGAGKRRESWFRLLASFRSRVVNELSKSREVDVRRGKDQRERTNSDLPWFCCLLLRSRHLGMSYAWIRSVTFHANV